MKRTRSYYFCISVASSARYFFITSIDAFISLSPPFLRLSISSPIFLKSCGSLVTSAVICSRCSLGTSFIFHLAYWFRRKLWKDIRLKEVGSLMETTNGPRREVKRDEGEKREHLDIEERRVEEADASAITPDGRHTEENCAVDGEYRIQPVDPELRRIRDARCYRENDGSGNRPKGREREISTGRLRNDEHDGAHDEDHAHDVAVIMRNLAVRRHVTGIDRREVSSAVAFSVV